METADACLLAVVLFSFTLETLFVSPLTCSITSFWLDELTTILMKCTLSADSDAEDGDLTVWNFNNT